MASCDKELHLRARDFNLEWYSGSGAGGQHRNKHQNCCRITHIETGLRAQGTESSQRVTNQRVAFERLAKLILSYYGAGREARRNTSEVIRNYHGARNEVKDKASGLRRTYVDVVEKGNLHEMIEARLKTKAGEDITEGD